MLKYFSIIIFIQLILNTASSQNIDSLKIILPSLHDRAKVDCLLKISFEYGHVNNDSDNVFTSVNNDSAIFYASIASKDAQKLNYKKGIADAYENLGEMAYNYSFLDGENYFKQAILVYDSINDFENLNWSYLWLGFYLNRQCRFAEAIPVLEKALFYYQRTGNKAREARTYRILGNSYLLRGYYKKAFEYSLKDITILQKSIKYQNDPIHASLRQGDLYMAAGDTVTALKYFKQGAQSSKAYNRNLYTGTRAYIDLLQHNYDSALYYSKMNDSTIYNGQIGDIYLLKREYDKALPYFFANLKIVKSMNDIYHVMEVTNNIAKVYTYEKKFKIALMYATQLLETAKSTHARQFIKDGSWLIWQIYDEKKNIDSAYKYRLEYDNINDTIAADELSRTLAVELMKFNDEEKQSQIDLLQKDNLINQQQLKNEATERKILIAVMIVTALLGIIIFRNFSLQRKNEKLESERKQTELQKKASQLEMETLRSQMNPHFIFNCLSSINRFILKNKTEEASDYLTKFSRLIRMVLNNSKQPFISLEDELETLRLYLEMERLRFKNSFDYSVTYNNSVDIDNIFIPPLLLQPFAENAIWHGLMHLPDRQAGKQEKGFLNFDFSAEERFLACTITDNGVGREQAELLKSKSADKQRSMGLKITTERLSILNSNSNEQTFFTIEDLTDENGDGIGTSVHLKIFYKQIIEV
jgi:tetratricopeptide (TPR) repeat protein